MQAERDCAGRSVTVSEANKIMAAVRDGVNFVNDFRVLGDLGEQAHGGKDLLAAGLEQNAGAEGADVLGLLEEIDLVAGSAGEKGKACSGDAATDDADAQPLSHY